VNPGDTPLDERLCLVPHKGREVYVIDFTHCSSKEMLLLLDQVRAGIAMHPEGSLLTLADFTGAEVDKNVATRMKEVLVLDRPYVKRSAWVGTESLPHIFYEHFKNFSQRDLPVFKTREEAMDWVVSEPPDIH
jgi:hypothetical protein